MDSSNPKKREGEKIMAEELASHLIKKSKSEPDLVEMFFKMLAGLAEWKKVIIRKLGFGALLGFTCTSNVTDIFLWLVDHLDPDSCTTTLEHGFSFTLSATTVNVILGFPLGNKTVYTTASKEADKIIHETVHIEYPTVEYLCSLLAKNVDVDEVTFSRTFMLAALSGFIAPNGRGVVSTRYYQAIIDFISSPDHDWCSFTLKWLMLHIKKYKSNMDQGLVTQIGGCKILPVITYFEFLITSEFNLGLTVPRLPLWSSHIINSYIALDSFSGSERKFGRLARKHISSTIFRGTCQTFQLQMPVEIQEYINKKFQGIMVHADKRKLELLAQIFSNRSWKVQYQQ